MSRFKQALSPTPAKVSTFQWLYLAGSLGAFWLMSDGFHVRGWAGLGSYALLAFFIASFILLTALIVPRQTLLLAMRTASIRVKLALVFNILTAFLLFEVLIVKWWARFFGVAMLFVSIWVGAFIFWKALAPLAGTISRFFFGDTAFDPKAGQGRRVRMD